MKLLDMLIYGFFFIGAIIVWIWLSISVFCALLGGGE